jgi:hypothetical protein
VGILICLPNHLHAEGCGGGGGSSGGGSGSGGAEQKPPIESTAQSSLGSKAQLHDVAKALQNAANIGTLNNDSVRAELQAQVNKAAELHQQMYQDAQSGKYDTRGMVGFWKDLANGLQPIKEGSQKTPETQEAKAHVQEGSPSETRTTALAKAENPAEAGKALVQMLGDKSPAMPTSPSYTTPSQTVVIPSNSSDKTGSPNLQFNDTVQSQGSHPLRPKGEKSFLVGELPPKENKITTQPLSPEEATRVREEAQKLFEQQKEAAIAAGDTKQVSLLEMVKADPEVYEKVIETIGEKISKRFKKYETLDTTLAGLTPKSLVTRKIANVSASVDSTPWISRTSTRIGFFALFGGLFAALSFLHYSDKHV